MKHYKFLTLEGHAGIARSAFSKVIARGLIATQLGVPQLHVIIVEAATA